jgi:excisionase family DNA binding protein
MADWISTREVAKELGCSAGMIRDMIKRGELPSATKRKLPSGRTAWTIDHDEVKIIEERYSRPGARRTPQRKIERGGRELYSCTACDQFRPREDFFPREKGRFGVRTQCIECEARVHRIYQQDNSEKLRQQGYERRSKYRTWVKTEGAKIMRAYYKDRHIDGNDVMDILRDLLPGRKVSEIEWQLGFSDGVVRRIAGNKITLSKADRLLTAAGVPEKLDELAPAPGLPGWSRKHDRCQNTTCGTIEIPHHAKGYCERCHYWMVLTNRDRPITDGWSMYVAKCRRCDRNDSPHTGRGLCNRCRHQMTREEFESYEPLYAALR